MWPLAGDSLATVRLPCGKGARIFGGYLTPVFLPGESYGQRSLAGYGPEGCKESDTTEAIRRTPVDLVIPRQVGSSQTRDQTHVSYRGKWLLYH